MFVRKFVVIQNIRKGLPFRTIGRSCFILHQLNLPDTVWQIELVVLCERKAGAEVDLRPGVVYMGLFACGGLPAASVFRAFDQLAVPV